MIDHDNNLADEYTGVLRITEGERRRVPWNAGWKFDAEILVTVESGLLIETKTIDHAEQEQEQ